MKKFRVKASTETAEMVTQVSYVYFDTCDAAIEFAICFATKNDFNFEVCVWDNAYTELYHKCNRNGKTWFEVINEKAAAFVEYWKLALQSKTAQIATLKVRIANLQAELEKAKAALTAITG